MGRFPRLDALILNAGVLPVESISIARGIVAFFKSPSNVAKTAADIIVQKVGERTSDNKFGEVFAANVLGHYGLVHELQDVMALTATFESKSSRGYAPRVFWTTSTTASQKYFNPNDPQCLEGFVYIFSMYLFFSKSLNFIN